MLATDPTRLADRYSGPGLYLNVRCTDHGCGAPVAPERTTIGRVRVTALFCVKDREHSGHVSNERGNGGGDAA